MASRQRSQAEQFLPLTANVFYILLALADGEKHGYGIILDIRDRTGGEVTIGTGTLYTAIKRLMIQGLIEETGRVDDEDPRRRYYRLASLGRHVARAQAREFEQLTTLARQSRLLPSSR